MLKIIGEKTPILRTLEYAVDIWSTSSVSMNTKAQEEIWHFVKI